MSILQWARHTCQTDLFFLKGGNYFHCNQNIITVRVNEIHIIISQPHVTMVGCLKGFIHCTLMSLLNLSCTCTVGMLATLFQRLLWILKHQENNNLFHFDTKELDFQ